MVINRRDFLLATVASSLLVPPKLRSSEGGWNRDEWDIALKSGVVCRIYQDRTTERWFLEGIYD